MNNVTKVKENVRRISQQREVEQAKRTDGCLLATCVRRAKWMKEHGTEIPLDECPPSCYYHPDFVPTLSYSSDVRSRRKTRVGQYSALEYQFQATRKNRQDGATCTDPSPF